jgi:hypothetical protein
MLQTKAQTVALPIPMYVFPLLPQTLIAERLLIKISRCSHLTLTDLTETKMALVVRVRGQCILLKLLKRNMLFRLCAITLLSVSTLVLPAKAEGSIRDIDFNNYTYNLNEGGMGPSGQIRLDQGRYKETDGFGFVELNSVAYRDFDGNGTEDALVVLGASGGGSGYSTHGYVFTYNNINQLRQAFYQMNFIDMTPYGLGFAIRSSSPLSTGKLVCPNDFLLSTDAIDIRLYQWSGTNFAPIRKTTLRGKQLCNLFLN